MSNFEVQHGNIFMNTGYKCHWGMGKVGGMKMAEFMYLVVTLVLHAK